MHTCRKTRAKLCRIKCRRMCYSLTVPGTYTYTAKPVRLAIMTLRDAWPIQNSETEDAYKYNRGLLRGKCSVAADYRWRIDSKTWRVCSHFRTRALHGYRTSNIVESANAMIPSAVWSHFYALDTLRMRKLRACTERKNTPPKDDLLTEYAQEALMIINRSLQKRFIWRFSIYAPPPLSEETCYSDFCQPRYSYLWYLSYHAVT
ncbi:hypothetical protein XU18_0565 [Perkinsela sp. CCAP 1560/4]|nr:hypothetical protein XU18_0565 [Perkinsela sp. CCAP 1560/4]|eukprot:KNH09287.1 hypothetical protein XU18_0565 [Perkinsela sp. CCAP 1560/4]